MEKPQNKINTKTAEQIKADPNAKMNFAEYKEIVTKDDIKKLEKNIKPFWWENFPVLGAWVYSTRTQMRVAEIDRGLLRKNLYIIHLIFVFAFLIALYGILFNLTPWFHYAILKSAIKRTKKKMHNQNLN